MGTILVTTDRSSSARKHLGVECGFTKGPVMSSDLTLTEEEFEKACSRLKRIEPDTREIARAVLVHRAKRSAIAKDKGLTRQRVSAMVSSVIAAHYEVPPSWERVEVWLPPDLASEVRTLAEKAHRAHRSKSADLDIGSDEQPS